MDNSSKKYFQNYMPENVCFGCGVHEEEGLHVKSFWEGDEAVSYWTPEEKYHGWTNLLNGGVIATLIDCHCMCTAMAHAYKQEGRALGSLPEYRYATGTIQVKYIAPTPIDHKVTLRAKVKSESGRKIVLECELFSGEVLTAESEVVAIRVYDSSQNQSSVFK